MLVRGRERGCARLGHGAARRTWIGIRFAWRCTVRSPRARGPAHRSAGCDVLRQGGLLRGSGAPAPRGPGARVRTRILGGHPLRGHPGPEPRPRELLLRPGCAGQRPDPHQRHAHDGPVHPPHGPTRSTPPSEVWSTAASHPGPSAEWPRRSARVRPDCSMPSRPREEIDFVGGLAAPFPITVIAELLGIAEADREDFRRWSDAAIESPDLPPTETMAALGELSAFIVEHIRAKRPRPGGTWCRCWCRPKSTGPRSAGRTCSCSS